MLENNEVLEKPKMSYFGNTDEFVKAALFFSFTKIVPEAVTVEGNLIKFSVHTEREKARCIGRNSENLKEIKRYFNKGHIIKVFNRIKNPKNKELTKIMIHKQVIPPTEYYRILIQVNGHEKKIRNR